jgi:hypothetical protein
MKQECPYETGMISLSACVEFAPLYAYRSAEEGRDDKNDPAIRRDENE